MSGLTLRFSDEGVFTALYRMERDLGEAGFAVGSGQRGAPTGVMYGDYTVMKWRNLSHDDRSHLHGVVTGDRRNGPLLFTLSDTAPLAARRAMSRLIHDRISDAYASGCNLS